MVSADWIKRLRRKKRKAAAYQYQKDCRYFAQIADSLKEAGADELAELGAEDVRPEFRVSACYIVLSFDKDKGPLKLAEGKGGKVIFLNYEESVIKPENAFMSSILKKVSKYDN